MGWNPYYVAYAAAHGLTPEEMGAIEDERPSKMTGFIAWAHDRWAEWAREHKRDRDYLTDADRAHFLAWLESRALKEAA